VALHVSDGNRRRLFLLSQECVPVFEELVSQGRLGTARIVQAEAISSARPRSLNADARPEWPCSEASGSANQVAENETSYQRG